MNTNNEYKKKLIQRSFNLARSVIAVTNKFPNNRASWIITDQLIRAITSIGANIIEAQAASSKKDFINFLNHALKSGNEGKFWLALAKDLDPSLTSHLDSLLSETDEMVRMLASSLVKLKSK